MYNCKNLKFGAYTRNTFQTIILLQTPSNRSKENLSISPFIYIDAFMPRNKRCLAIRAGICYGQHVA